MSTVLAQRSLRSKVALVARQTMATKWDSVEEEISSSGTWETHKTRGSGDHCGRLGLYMANWGANWTNKETQDHMLRDVKSSPCHILCLQECTQEPQEYLELPAEKPAAESTQRSDKESKFLVVRGPEKEILVISVRESLVPAIRLNWYYRSQDGTYKMTCSRIMIATVQLRHYRLRGRGDEEIDELPICNAHFNSNTAKKEVKEGAHAYNSFFDELARSMAQFQCRFLCGDFNMALYAVVPELRRRRRARGFQINMAAWYCWKDSIRGGGAVCGKEFILSGNLEILGRCQREKSRRHCPVNALEFLDNKLRLPHLQQRN